jgi:hypothetical protein
MMKRKYCPHCNQLKPLSQFNKRHADCRDCQAQQSIRRRNKVKAFMRRMAKKYGIDDLEFLVPILDRNLNLGPEKKLFEQSILAFFSKPSAIAYPGPRAATQPPTRATKPSNQRICLHCSVSGRKFNSRLHRGCRRFVPILLQKSFCTGDQKFSGL